MRRSRLGAIFMLVAVLLLALGATLSAILSSGSDSIASDSTQDQDEEDLAPPVTLPPSLDDLGLPGEELTGLAEAGRDATYHATYAVSDPQIAPGSTETLEIWRDGTSIRTDVISEGPNSTARSSAVATGSSSIACNTVDGVERCSTNSSGPIQLPEAFIASVADSTAPGELAVRDAEVAGVPGRCFAAPGVGELCLRDDGALLSIDLSGTRAVLIMLEDEVSPDAFDTDRG